MKKFKIICKKIYNKTKEIIKKCIAYVSSGISYIKALISRAG